MVPVQRPAHVHLGLVDLAGDGGKEDEAGVLHLADGERQRGEGREGGLVDSGREEDELDELRVHRRIAVEGVMPEDDRGEADHYRRHDDAVY